MKTNPISRKSLFAICLLFLLSIKLNAQIDQQSITITGEGYTENNFEVDGLFWNNRTYTIKPVQDLATDPSGATFFPFNPDFDGFKFAQNGATAAEGGTITPSANGYVYAIGKESEGLTRWGTEWTVVPNSEFTYYHPTLFSYTTLVVFQHVAVANTPINLPLVSGFTGVNPIAKTISIQLPMVQGITIDGVNIESFNEATLSYNYKLPYTTITPPVVDLVGYSINTNYTVTQATNINGSEIERTATIYVTRPDNSVTSYKVIFEVVPELDLFLCIGQSNMSGRDGMNASLGDFIPVDNAYLYATSGFIDAVNPFNGYTNIGSTSFSGQGVSPSYSFSKKITDNVTNKIGLVVNARGGSDLVEWDDKTDNLYSKTMERALEAKKWGTYKAVLWHQGEADVSAGDVAAYPNQLTNLVAHLREDLGDPNLLFVAGQIGQFNTSHTNFNNMIITISSFINNTACVLSDGLTDKGDNLHFNRASQIVLGERYADIVLDKVYGISLGTDEFKAIDNSIIMFYNQKLHIDIDVAYDIFIYDITGKKLYSKKNENNQIIDLKKYQDGIYIVKVKSNGKVVSKKIITH